MNFQQIFQDHGVPEQMHSSFGVYHTEAGSDFSMHCHSFYEISYTVKGDRMETRNGVSYRLRENELIFYPPLAFHSSRNIDETDVAVIQFSSEFLRNTSSILCSWITVDRPYGESPVFSPAKGGKTYNLLQKIIEYYKEYYNQPDYEPPTSLINQFLRNGLILELLSAMIEEKYLTLLYGTGMSTRMEALDSVINHLLTHPEEKTDMKQAAQLAHMSYYSFSRFFKETMGINFSDYCNLIRIRIAEEKLISTDLPIADIAAEIGIDTPSYFSNLFKSIDGISPADYRAKNRLK